MSGICYDVKTVPPQLSLKINGHLDTYINVNEKLQIQMGSTVILL